MPARPAHTVEHEVKNMKGYVAKDRAHFAFADSTASDDQPTAASSMKRKTTQ